MIKNVIFDIGKVLIKFEWLDYVSNLISDEKIRKHITDAIWNSGLWNELDRGVLAEQEVIDKLRESASPYNEEFDKVIENFGCCIGKQEYAIPWIEELHSKKINVYYLSNYSDFLIRANNEALDFLNYVDGGVFSHKIHIMKPSKDIFKYLVNKYNLESNECLFIDDVQANVDGARKFGMKAIRFDGYDKVYPVVMEYINNGNDAELVDLAGKGLPFDGMNWEQWEEM